ncbi:hypothetical protein ACLB1Q_34695 [Escherichia coli]
MRSGLTILYQLLVPLALPATISFITRSLRHSLYLSSASTLIARMQLSEYDVKNDGDDKWSCWTLHLAERKSSSVAADTPGLPGQQ